MSKAFRNRILAVVVCALAQGAGVAWAVEPFLPTPQDGLLLLANGQVIACKITHSGEYYYVALENGELRLKNSEVQMFCRSLEEGYQRKRAAMIGGQISEHLELADWCIDQQLFGLAARELTEAVKIDPRHPKIGLLTRRMNLAQQGAETPAEKKSGAIKGPTAEDLDRLARTLPEGTVDSFTHTIQPLLLNNCTKSGCHSSASGGKMSLLRIPVGRPSSRNQTLRNLHAVVAQINMSQPANSPLLTVPLKEHGTARAPIFSNHEMLQYRQLILWVHRVAQSNAPSEPMAGNLPQTAAVSPASSLPANASAGNHPAATVPGNLPVTALDRRPPEPLLQALPTPPGLGSASAATSPSATVGGKSAGDGYTPIDPFDPEIFNRRAAGGP